MRSLLPAGLMTAVATCGFMAMAPTAAAQPAAKSDLAPPEKGIQEALSRAEQLPHSGQVALFKETAAETRRLADSNQFVKEALDDALESSAAADDEQQAAATLKAGLRKAERILSFKPFLEAKLPDGFPELTPVGEIRVKSYPAYRLARTTMAAGKGQSQAFFTLFKHITQEGIAMTAPVEITYSEGQREVPKREAMAFLYGTPTLGEASQEGKVAVIDVPAMSTVSLGVQGDYAAERVAVGEAFLRAWLRQHGEGYEVVGPLRVLGYNSPMVPSERRYAEIELPVRKKQP